MERMRERKQERIPKNSLQSSTEKKQRERERERAVIEQKGGRESSDYQQQVVVGDRIADHRASTYRRT